MSKIVKTSDGLIFNCVTDAEAKRKWFILTCPDCGEMLQLTSDMMDGKEPMVHESKKYKDSYCTYGREPFPIGASLVAAMQTNMLMIDTFGSPFTPEDRITP